MPRKGQKMPRWTEEDVALLVKLHPTLTNAEVAEKLGRPVGSISSKAHTLRLEKAPGYRSEINRANRLRRKPSDA